MWHRLGQTLLPMLDTSLWVLYSASSSPHSEFSSRNSMRHGRIFDIIDSLWTYAIELLLRLLFMHFNLWVPNSLSCKIGKLNGALAGWTLLTATAPHPLSYLLNPDSSKKPSTGPLVGIMVSFWYQRMQILYTVEVLATPLYNLIRRLVINAVAGNVYFDTYVT